jgi:hypothetical protein
VGLASGTTISAADAPFVITTAAIRVTAEAAIAVPRPFIGVATCTVVRGSPTSTVVCGAMAVRLAVRDNPSGKSVGAPSPHVPS